MSDEVNEFSFIVKLDEIGAGAVQYQISANESQRTALCARFGLMNLDRLAAEFTLLRTGMTIIATGQLHADVAQACIANGAMVAATINEPFEVRFMTESTMEAQGEVELAAEDCDNLLYDGKSIDIGEAAAQSLALALNPYPRSDEAVAILQSAGVKSEEEAILASGPFAALSALKRQ
jgi:uncharacterized metal-binding protein YceD (DUF177 family)